MEDLCRLTRVFLPYNSKDKRLYCSVCLAFSDHSSIFCKGFDRYRHLAQTVGEHEQSKIHLLSVKSFVVHNQNKTTYYLLLEKHLNKRKQEVAERRKVLNGVIDVIKMIGKQGMALRYEENGIKKVIASVTRQVNHGHFLEVFLLLSNYDETIAKHVKELKQFPTTVPWRWTKDVEERIKVQEGEVTHHF